MTRVSCDNFEFTITLTMYGNTNSGSKPGAGILNFGDGTSFTIPVGDFLPRPDLGNAVGVFNYTVNHLYAKGGRVTVSYQEANRNGLIVNIANSVSTPFYIESMVYIDSKVCNSTPKLLAAPIDKACNGLAFYHNPGVFDSEGDSISYSLVTPKASESVLTVYTSPNNARYYDSNFNTGNEAGDGPPEFEIDAFTGNIYWDAPGMLGEYNIAFRILEWRRVDGEFILVGFVTRDMQIVVEECNNSRPDLSIPQDLCVFIGIPINEVITGFDPDGHSIKIEAFSGLFNLVDNPAQISPALADYQPSGSSVNFSWTPSCEDLRKQPYQVTLKITDNPPSGPRLVKYKVWNIKVVALPPALKEVTLDVVNKKNFISWDFYACDNISKVEVWRKVGSNPFVQTQCDSGMPRFAGYTKIAEVLPTVNNYTDDNEGRGLASGAVYCYRITLLFNTIDKAESQVSVELCTPPILANAPIITNVSVETTDEQSGAVRIKWRKPYEFDNPAYEKIYQYSILRADELSGNTNLQQATLRAISDTTYTDIGLDTKNLPHNYRIVLLARKISSSEFVSVDTSEVASSVWNLFTPREGSIELNWFADTPWSNFDPTHPMHLIYRRAEGSPNQSLVLIDSVNVLENGFTYTDVGKYQNQPLVESEFYYYQIKTRGTYGNPSISSPLENLSQVIQANIIDKVPPCPPKMNPVENNCQQFNLTVPCAQKQFSNEITWQLPDDPTCLKDVYEYQVFAADSANGNFVLIGKTRTNTFIEQNLTHRSRCYKIFTVDRAGNLSEEGEMVCFDNCPSINFPNVFTPNGDDYNPFFTSYNTDGACTRFIKQVSLSVFNRWGKKIAELNGDDSLQWDGNDMAGHALPTGVYFYRAEVVYDVIEPSKKLAQIKGWVHLVR